MPLSDKRCTVKLRICSSNWFEACLLSNHALFFSLLMHRIFTTLKNIIEMIEMWTEVTQADLNDRLFYPLCLHERNTN